MVGPTLEQVLARSLRVPKSRAMSFFNTNASASLKLNVRVEPAKDTTKPTEEARRGSPVVPSLRVNTAEQLQQVASREGFHSALNGEDLKSLLVCARRVGDWKTALKAIDSVLQTQAFTLNDSYLQALINVCAATDHLDDISEMIDRLNSQTLPEASSRALLRLKLLLMEAYGLSERHESAMKLLRKEPIPDVEFYNAGLIACERAGAWETALEVLREMMNAGEEKNIKPDAISYAAVISALEKASQPKLAAELLEQVPAKEKEAIMSSYAALINVWGVKNTSKLRRRF